MKFSALLGLCGPFVLHCFAQGTRPFANSGPSEPMCTIGLHYCGQTLMNKGWPESDILKYADKFDQDNQFLRDNVRRLMFKCGNDRPISPLTPGITWTGGCRAQCVDGGAGKDDYCAPYWCTPGLKYCTTTLLSMGYTNGHIIQELGKASGGGQWPSTSDPLQMKDWVLQCRPDGLWYEGQCRENKCVDAGAGRSDYCSA